MNTYSLKKKIREKKDKARSVVEVCATEERDMSPGEKESFDALIADVATLKDQYEKLSALDASEEDEDDEKEVEPEPRSRRVSSPHQGVGHAPAVHTKKHRYNLLRAMQANLEQRNLDGFEGEISQEISRRHGKSPQGFYMPTGMEPEFRDLTTTTGTGAVFVVPELPFIELLRNKLVISDLGATFLTGMSGKFSIPRQNAAGGAFWVAEAATITTSNQTLDQVAFVDKTLGAATNMSRKFIYQSSIDAETFVKNDLARVLAIEIDRVAINGSGSGAQPTGILQNSTVQTNSASLAVGTNGGEPTWAKVVAMETQVAAANADRGSLRYLTSPSLRGNLKSTPKVGTTFPTFIWEGDALNENNVPVGEVNGYPAYATNNVPANLTKGTATNCSAMIFGNFEDLVIAQWGGIDVVVNPFTGQLSGAVQVSMLMEIDLELRHPESFAIITDFLIA